MLYLHAPKYLNLEHKSEEEFFYIKAHVLSDHGQMIYTSSGVIPDNVLTYLESKLVHDPNVLPVLAYQRKDSVHYAGVVISIKELRKSWLKLTDRETIGQDTVTWYLVDTEQLTGYLPEGFKSKIDRSGEDVKKPYYPPIYQCPDSEKRKALLEKLDLLNITNAYTKMIYYIKTEIEAGNVPVIQTYGNGEQFLQSLINLIRRNGDEVSSCRLAISHTALNIAYARMIVHPIDKMEEAYAVIDFITGDNSKGIDVDDKMRMITELNETEIAITQSMAVNYLAGLHSGK